MNQLNQIENGATAVENRRAEERLPQNRAAVLITESRVAFPANVVDASHRGIGLMLSHDPDANVGSKVTLRFRQRDLVATVVRSHELDGRWRIGLQLNEKVGLEFFEV